MNIEDHRFPSKADYQRRLEKLIEFSRGYNRNCAVITLADDQNEAIRVAESLGFSTVKEFYNPNSGNKVRLMVHIIWGSREEYRGSQDEEDEE